MSSYGTHLLRKIATVLRTGKAQINKEIIAEQTAYIKTLKEQRELYKEIADACIKKYAKK